MALTRKEISERYRLRHLDDYRTRQRDIKRKENGSTLASMQVSNVWRARGWETKVAKLLFAVDVNAEIPHAPYDLLLFDKKIDLKIAELKINSERNGRLGEYKVGWHFKTSGEAKCDYYLCLCLAKDEIIKAYLLPSKEKNRTGMAIGERTRKFAGYEVQLPLSAESVKRSM